jgi:hypothetical protein
MNRKMVEVYSANNELEAQVIKGLLESNGITCLLQPYAISSFQDILVPGSGVVRVLVPAESAEEASKLIEAKE